MKLRLALLVLLLATAAQAQQRQPANVSTLPQSNPQEFDLLDNTGAWVPFGSVDPTTHTTIGLGKEFYVRQFGPHNDWVGDDGPAIAAALAAAGAAGGGTVYLDQKPYWNQTQNLGVPRNVTLRCVGYFSKSLFVGNPNAIDYANYPCTIYQKAGTTLTVGGGLINLGVFQDRVHFPLPGGTSGTGIGDSRQSRVLLETFINGFTGVGVDVHQHQAFLDNLLIGGFATCVQTENANQMRISAILGDCTNGLDISLSFDDNFLSSLEFWPWLTAGNSHGNETWTISALADNGAGLWRVTTSTTNNLTTGEKIWISPGTSAQGAGGQWTITVIDSTHFDLQGSADGPITTTGTTTLFNAITPPIGNTYVPVASTDNLAPGMSVSDGGVNIPTGATVGAVWRTRKAISLDQNHPAQAAASNVTLTFTNQPYTSGGVAAYDGTWRTGTGFAIGRADGTMCSMCFAFGYQTGFHFRQAVGVGIINAQNDQSPSPPHLSNQNVTPIGVRFSTVGTVPAYSNIWKGSMITGNGVLVYSDLGAAGGSSLIGNTVEVDRLAFSSPYATAMESASGGMVLKNAVGLQAGTLLMDNSTQAPFLVNNRLPLVQVYATTATPNMYFGHSLLGGNLDQRTPTVIGAQRIIAAQAAGPAIDWYSTAGATDEKFWRWYWGAGGPTPAFCMQAVNDAYLAPSTNALCAHRTGITVNDLTTYAPTIIAPLNAANPAMTVSSTDNTASPTSGGGLRLTNTGTGATAPSKTLRVAQAGQFQILNNAYNAFILSVDDAGNVVSGAQMATAAYTIGGTLPSCGAINKGGFAYVTNAQTTPTYLGAVSTTGAVVAPVFCNGSAWVYH